MQLTTNIAARDAVLAVIQAAQSKKPGQRGSIISTDWTRANWLRTGEQAICIVGGFANSIIYSPAGARSDTAVDRLLFYGPDAVLVHEEPVVDDTARVLGFIAPTQGGE